MFDTMERLTGVSYPASPTGGGNGTSGVFSADEWGRPVETRWNQPGAALLTSDKVTGRDLTGRVTDYHERWY
ncbi:MAG: hypothetical protein V9F03_10445 [Microthrixaceae bacterium]